MNAYTVSRLALDAGVSVHIVRDYLLRGLLRPVACTTGGYGVFDDAALQRLCFVRAAFEAGIGLDALARLCRALDAQRTATSRRAACRAAPVRRAAARSVGRSGSAVGHHADRAGTARGESAVNSPERLPPETRNPFTGYLWGALAVLTCPCHLPILAAVLAGTTAGAFLGEHWGIAALALTGLFVLSVTRLLRAFRGGS
jgi:mercuric resistance transcriptional repressor protein MerD